MKIRIISSCTDKKSYTAKNPLSFEELQRVRKGETLPKISNLPMIKAKELYTGMQHRYLIEGIKASKHDIDLYIISAGYGVVSAKDNLYPYNSTFSGKSKNTIMRMSDVLNIPAKISEINRIHADITLVLLGKDYLMASGFSEIPESDISYFFTSKSALHLIPHGVKTILLGNPEATRFGAPLVSLKGKVAGKFLIFLNSIDSPGLLPLAKDELLRSIE